MALIQAIRQQQRFERSDAPLGNTSVIGGRVNFLGNRHFGQTVGPHLMNSGPVFKASNLMHGIKIRAAKLPHISKIPSFKAGRGIGTTVPRMRF